MKFLSISFSKTIFQSKILDISRHYVNIYTVISHNYIFSLYCFSHEKLQNCTDILPPIPIPTVSAMNPRYNDHGTSPPVVVEGGPLSALLTICDPVSCCWCCAVLCWTLVTWLESTAGPTQQPVPPHCTPCNNIPHTFSLYIFNTKFKYKIDK